MPKISSSQSADDTAVEAADAPFSLISNEKLLAIYAVLIKCSLLQQCARDLFQRGKLGSDLHACWGREASATAIGVDLLPSDTLSIVAGDWLPAFVNGLPLETIFRSLSYNEQEKQGPSAGSNPEQAKILIAASVEEHRQLVARHVSRTRVRAKNAVITVFLSPRENSLSAWKSFMESAAEARYPVILVRHVRDTEATSRSERKSKNPQALVNGLPEIVVDAMDPVALCRVSYEAMCRARQGRGATLIECVALQEAAAASIAQRDLPPPPDPVSTLAAFLRSKGIQPEQPGQQIAAEFHRELEVATRFLKN